MSVVTWPVRRQTYGYLPSHKASPPIGWYQIILLGDRGTCVLKTCPGLHSTAGRLGFEPTTYWSQVKHPTATPYNSRQVLKIITASKLFMPLTRTLTALSADAPDDWLTAVAQRPAQVLLSYELMTHYNMNLLQPINTRLIETTCTKITIFND